MLNRHLILSIISITISLAHAEALTISNAPKDSATEFISLSGQVNSGVQSLAVQISPTRRGIQYTNFFTVENGRFNLQLQLAFGQQPYDISIYERSCPAEEKCALQGQGEFFSVNLTGENKSPVEFKINQVQINNTDSTSDSFAVKGVWPKKNGWVSLYVMRELEGTGDKSPAYKGYPWFIKVNSEGQFADRVYFKMGSGKYYVHAKFLVCGTPFQKSCVDDGSDVNFFVQNRPPQQRYDLLPSWDVESDSPEIVKKAQEIVSGLTTDEEKSKAIFEWVAQNIKADMELYQKMEWKIDESEALPSATYVLAHKSTICMGYANLNAALHRAVGIPAQVIGGRTNDGGDHAWNFLYINNRWIIADPTWASGGRTEDNEFKAQYDKTQYDIDPTVLVKTRRPTMRYF